MKRFKNILVIYNHRTDNKMAFKKAAWIAKSNNAKLSLIEVIEEVPYYLKETVTKDRTDNLRKSFSAAVKEEMKVDYAILIGTPFVEIIKEVIKMKYDLVIIEPQEPIGLLTRIFSSLTIHLIRKCPCPVWVMRPKEITEKGYRILAAIDAKADEEEVHSMNKKIMEISSSLALMVECELHVVHAWRHPWEQMMKTRTELTKHVKYKAIKEIRISRQNYLDKLLENYPMEKIEHKVHLHKGEPIDVIPNCIAVKEIDMIVMGTVCKSSIVGLIVGNTCDDILQQVNCSVLALKPEGFVSPIPL
ncbi:MAG: universal stress protein [bacterium]|nr:universal stress protein [bacterium]